MMKQANQYDVILGPVITEKSTIGSEHGQVTFEVPMTSTKPQIKAAVENLFDVKVKAVNTIRRPGKSKKFRGIVGSQRSRKKAIVTLEDGHTIDVTTGLS